MSEEQVLEHIRMLLLSDPTIKHCDPVTEYQPSRRTLGSWHAFKVYYENESGTLSGLFVRSEIH